MLSPIPDFDLTVTFGALKPAHRLMPAMASMGRVVLADIGIEAGGQWHEIGAPDLPPLDPAGHKYDRGLVHCLAGEMPGAIALAATAAARAGAGYVRVSTSRAIDGLAAAVVQTDTADLNDPRVGCILVGPGLGDIPQVLTLALTAQAPKVIDADGIGLVGEPERLQGQDVILTPHEGEFVKPVRQDRGQQGRARTGGGAASSQSVIVYKGADTLVAAPDGRSALLRRRRPGWQAPEPATCSRESSRRCRARGLAPFEAACAGVWLHGRAAEIAGPAMIADDLARCRSRTRSRSSMTEPIVRIAARGTGSARAAAMSPSRCRATCCSTMARSSRARTTRTPPCRHFPNAAGASFSI